MVVLVVLVVVVVVVVVVDVVLVVGAAIVTGAVLAIDVEAQALRNIAVPTDKNDPTFTRMTDSGY